MSKRKIYDKWGAMRLIKEDMPAAVVNLLTFLNKLLPLTGVFNEVITPMLKAYVASKRFEFAKAGDEVKTALWVESGYIRLYRMVPDKNGVLTDETIGFGLPKNILVVPECFFNGEKCSYFIDIAKSSVVVPFTRDFFDELKLSAPEAEALANIVLSLENAPNIERSVMMRMHGEAKYDQFMELFGEEINQFFKQKHFASFLGLTTVYLSQLRAKRNRRKRGLPPF